MTVNITFTGFGGQGIIKTSVLLAQAAMRQGKHSLQNQAYGPQSRGGISKGDVVISDSHIYEVEPEECDILVALSQQAFDKYSGTLKKGGLLLYDSGLVKIPDGAEFGRKGAIEATRIASEDFGNRLMAGTIMLGLVAASAGVIDRAVLEKTLAENLPKDSVRGNLAAFARGWKAAAGITRI